VQARQHHGRKSPVGSSLPGFIAGAHVLRFLPGQARRDRLRACGGGGGGAGGKSAIKLTFGQFARRMGTHAGGQFGLLPAGQYSCMGCYSLKGPDSLLKRKCAAKEKNSAGTVHVAVKQKELSVPARICPVPRPRASSTCTSASASFASYDASLPSGALRSSTPRPTTALCRGWVPTSSRRLGLSLRAGKNKRSHSSILATCNLAIFPCKVASLPRLVTPAKVPDMAAQLQGMFRTPSGFVSTKTYFLTVGSRRNGHHQI
jgi:hypothetical protein